jgi:hypothetical protein
MTMVIQTILTPLGGGPASLSGSESEIDEGIELMATGGADVGKHGVSE